MHRDPRVLLTDIDQAGADIVSGYSLCMVAAR